MNRRAKFITTVILVLAASTGIAREGQAQSRGKQTAESHYDKGMKAYTIGHFQEAIEEFEKAFELRSEPIFLYNIAQSHRQSNNLQRAIFFYRRYLEADPKVKNRAEIEKRIKDMEAQLDEQKEHAGATQGATMMTAPGPAQPNTPAPAAAPQPLPVVVQPYPTPVGTAPMAKPTETTPQGRGLRIAGIATASVGVVAVAAGIAFGFHANSLHDEAYPAPPLGYNASKDQDSKSFRTLEWVTIGIGSAAVVTGGVLYYLGVAAKDATLAFAPFAAPGAGGAALVGRF